MPRLIDSRLLAALDRANPNVAHFVEVNAPDVGQVLRRATDQFLAPVSQTPANAIAADPAGALTMASTATNLASFTVPNDNTVALPRAALTQSLLRGLRWSVDKSFGRAVIRSFTANVRRKNTDVTNNLRLQIYRLQGQAVVGTSGGPNNPGEIVTFVPLLPQPAICQNLPSMWTFGTLGTAVFDLTKFRLELGTSNVPAASLFQTGEDQAYYFALEPENGSADDLFYWFRDRTTARGINGVGTFEDFWWYRLDSNDPTGWVEHHFGDGFLTAGVPAATIAIESYAASAQAVYALNLARVPAAAAEGRIVLERSLPTGTAATLELSTAGSGGPWTGVTEGDVVAVKQAAYHLRATLLSNATHRLAPRVAAMGLEFRIPVDVTAESIVEPITHEIDVPFLQASIGEGRVDVLRTGRRDYRDLGSDLAVGSASSQLEVDVRLGSRHPSAPRASWLLVDRAFVNNRTPSSTAEQFGLLSYLKTLKRKIPARAETLNEVRTVASAAADHITIAGSLPDIADGPYDHKNYYMRVRSSAQAGVESGYLQNIDRSSGTSTMLFDVPLPGVPVAGDVVEIHSASYVQDALRWADADPYDVWLEILTVHLGIPLERIGRGDLGQVARGGFPPRIVDRAPGDVDTQAKLRVTLKLAEATSADELIDQLSFIMGGATVEIGGQIVFRQIYPLRDATGQIVVPAEPVAAVFDVRNTIGLDTPTGLEQRITQLACDFGVNTTAVSDDERPAQTTNFVDADALAWLDDQPVDELAASAIPDEIARWCYNSADAGLYLASMLTQQVVRAASTGLRVWPWSTTEARPELVIGDRVVVVTDRYTDYDPARKQQIRGFWAYTLVLVSVRGGGRAFRGYMLGLTDAVQIKGGQGTLAVDDGKSATEILSVTFNDSADGKTRAYVVTAGSAVESLFVHHRLWPIGAAGDLFDFTAQQHVNDDLQLLTLRPDPADGKFRYTLTHPVRGFQIPQVLVPRRGPPSFVFGEEVWKEILDPAPPAVNAKLHPTRAGAIAALAIDVAFGASDGPVIVDVIEDSGTTSTTILTTPLTAPATLDSGTYAVLGGRTLPAGKDALAWRVRITDVSGQPYWFGPASINRDPLPNGNVVVSNYRATPALGCAFDPDTDQIRITLPDGRTKTFNTAALLALGSPVTYTVGMVLDDASTELALAVDEARTPYVVEYQGGGQWVKIAPGVTLHGQPSNPPTADVREEFNSTRDAANVFIRPDTQVDEKLFVYYREGSTDTALEWIACVSAGDPTPLQVVAGTQLGPANFFRRVDGIGSPAAKLASIPLNRDQIAKHGAMIEGVDSGMQSPWLDVVLSVMEKPWNESFSLEWNEATGEVFAIVAAGAHTLFETVQLADNALFTSPTTQTAVISDGTVAKLTFALSQAQRGKTWYGRAKPNNKNDGSGLDGEYQSASVAVPANFTVQPSAAETASQGTLTLVVSDPGQVLDPAWTNGTITTPIHFQVLRLGVATIEAPTTAPGGGATTGTFTKVITLLDHPVQILVFAHLRDGSIEPLGAFTFDSNKVSDLVIPNVVDNGVNADVTLRWDSDAAVGVNKMRYSLNGGGSWTNADISALYLSQFSVTRTGAAQTLLVEAINAIDGAFGNRSTLKISPFVASEMALPQGTVSIDANGNVGYSLDGPANAQSVKFATSTSGFPADATALAASAVNGQRVFSSAAATLSFGQTFYLTAIFFTGTGGTGTAYPSIHIRGSYQSYSGSKTTNYAPNAWQDVTDTSFRNALTPFDGTNQNLWPTPSAGHTQTFTFDFVLPDGVTLTQVAFRVVSYVDGSTFLVDSVVFTVQRRASGSVTSIGNVTATSAGNWTVGLSESTTSRTYSVKLDIANYRASGGILPELIIGEVAATYTQPDPKKGI